MSRLDQTGTLANNAATQLRRERAELLTLAERRCWRLHRLNGLTGELKRVTTELLRQELKAARPVKPLGDARAARAAAGNTSSPRLPYKD